MGWEASRPCELPSREVDRLAGAPSLHDPAARLFRETSSTCSTCSPMYPPDLPRRQPWTLVALRNVASTSTRPVFFLAPAAPQVSSPEPGPLEHHQADWKVPQANRVCQEMPPARWSRDLWEFRHSTISSYSHLLALYNAALSLLSSLCVLCAPPRVPTTALAFARYSRHPRPHGTLARSLTVAPRIWDPQPSCRDR